MRATKTLTFLFTDIGGSTRKWESDPAAMAVALDQHNTIVGGEIEKHDGHVFKTGGDAFYATFPSPADALEAAIAIQSRLEQAEWPFADGLAVRIGLHSGVEGPGGYNVVGDDFFGNDVNRVARIHAIAHPGQIIGDAATMELARSAYRPIDKIVDHKGVRLKDLAAPVHIIELRRGDGPSEFPPLLSLDRLPTNLPSDLPPIFGRETELARLRVALSDSRRITTVIGGAGYGKSRFAMQAAADSIEAFPDGCRVIDFDTEQPRSTLETIAEAIGIPAARNVDDLAQSLEDRRVLLLMDNCDVHRNEVVPIVEALIAKTRYLRILATSREALHIPGETILRLETLDAATAATVLREALNARDLRDVGNADVALLATAVDGIPAALQLIAGVCATRAIREILESLEHGIDVLSSPHAGGRATTMNAMIQWGWDALTPSQRTLAEALSVFVDGWTLAAAAACCGAEGRELGDLVSRSIVELRGERYAFLAPVRAFAKEHLVSPQRELLYGAHCEYFIRFAAENVPLLPRLRGFERQRIRAELGNLRRAFEFALAANDGRVPAFGRDLTLIARAFGELRFAASIADRLAETLPNSTAAVALLSEAVPFGRQVLGGDRTIALATRAMQIAEALDEPWAIAAALVAEAVASTGRMPLADITARYTKALAIFEQIGNAVDIGRVHYNLAALAVDRNDTAAAAEHFSLALDKFSEAQDEQRIAYALFGLGRNTMLDGDLTAASDYADESLRMRRELGDRRGEAESLLLIAEIAAARDQRPYGPIADALAIATDVGWSLGEITAAELAAGVFVADGQAERAAECLGAGEALRRRAQIAHSPLSEEKTSAISATIATTIAHKGRLARLRGSQDPSRVLLDLRGNAATFALAT